MRSIHNINWQHITQWALKFNLRLHTINVKLMCMPPLPEPHTHTHNNNKDIMISSLQGFHLQINTGYTIDSENVFTNSPEFPVLMLSTLNNFLKHQFVLWNEECKNGVKWSFVVLFTNLKAMAQALLLACHFWKFDRQQKMNQDWYRIWY